MGLNARVSKNVENVVFRCVGWGIVLQEVLEGRLIHELRERGILAIPISVGALIIERADFRL